MIEASESTTAQMSERSTAPPRPAGQPHSRPTHEFRDDPLRGWSPRRLWSAGGHEGARRLVRMFACEADVATAVGAKDSTVRRRLRRLGIVRWPRPKTSVRLKR